MTFLRSLAVGTTLLGVAACSSAPTRYYTLISPMTPVSTAVSNEKAPFQLEVLPVRMPVQVDQPQLVVRQSNGSLAILETERWTAPLADEFHDALASQLEQSLGVRDLAGLPKNAGLPIVSLRTDVRRFDSAPNSYALIDVVWSLGLRGEGTTRRHLTCSSVVRQPSGEGFENLVLAHQQAVNQLAETIAQTARAWVLRAETPCPSR
ncbi:hypothetical protein IQ22_01545 [Pseudomonas duriflava]|uniref:ABC-type transport auxiliary lipoprotein component domain-containing protein n=1 Tax=Pseudomonas duriflava TaxID=459528 RepID=A0A562QFX0_9PSED|nr:PqiC family protein [Pseudomonas duriflava]TWI55619.1 hypothetical protein IQ22_01545 [Pseudomonas duriflava]